MFLWEDSGGGTCGKDGIKTILKLYCIKTYICSERMLVLLKKSFVPVLRFTVYSSSNVKKH